MRLPIAAKESPSLASPDDWRWQARNAATSLVALESRLSLSEAERQGIRQAEAKGLPMSITPYYLALCDPEDEYCPIRLQCVPRAEESQTVPGDLKDPLGEQANEVAPHLVRRYPDRALLIATDRCGLTVGTAPVVGPGRRSLRELAPAFSWL